MTVLYRVTLAPQHVPTGRTIHRGGGVVLPPPARLEIEQGARPEEGFFLNYIAADGQQMTDTWHRDIAAAMRQAESEFSIAPSEWERV